MKFSNRYLAWCVMSFRRSKEDEGQNELFKLYDNGKYGDVHFQGRCTRMRVLRIFNWTNGNSTAVLVNGFMDDYVKKFLSLGEN